MAIFGGLDTEAYDRTYSDWRLLKRIASYFVPHKKQLMGAIFFLILISASGAAQPIVVSQGVEFLTSELTTTNITVLVTLMTVLGISIWLSNWLRRRILARIISDVVSALRHDAFSASINHDLAFFDRFETGNIISRITTDTQEFAQVTQLVTEIITQILLVLILLIVLFNISVTLTLILLLLAPVLILMTLGFRKLARIATAQGFRVLGKVNTAIQEIVTGISVAKNFRQEKTVYKDFQEVNQKSYVINLRRGIIFSGIFPIMTLISSSSTAALLYLGGKTALAGVVSVGAWYLFMVSIDRFWFPLINLAAFWSQFQAGLSASERIFALIDADPTVQQTDNQPVACLQGDIVFDKVDFRYSRQQKIFDQFSVHIKPGETVALVGHTGAGKSSLIKLITRFYEFQGGEIVLDGGNIRNFDLGSYRRHLGLVSQNPFLFAGTVADNIRYARPEVTDAEIEAIAREIGEGEWLETLPEGLQSDVGERGGRLSMGQRQLVALVRVLVQKPAIFILDEATASIDPFTENQIQEAMDLILENSTAIIIAHRLSTVRNADRILVLENGGIIEEGDHETLMRQGGHYAELYNTYFRHQSLEYIETVGRRKGMAVIR